MGAAGHGAALGAAERALRAVERGLRQRGADGLGVGVAPELQVRPLLASGELVALRPEVQVDVALYWHQWKLGGETPAPGGTAALAEGGMPPALLDQIGEALARGARDALIAG